MAKNWLTDEQVEKEIESLQKSPYVKLARKDQQVKYRRRQYLYGLRQLEKKGVELSNAGVTIEMLEMIDKACDE